VYVYNYFPTAGLLTANYVSTLLAAVIYIFVFGKFYRATRATQGS